MVYDFRYENSINNGREKIELDTEYSQWRTNSVLSNHIDCILFVNEMNLYSVTDKMHYDYLFGAINKRKRWSKGESKEEKKKKEIEEKLISLVSEKYKYNRTRAKELIRILKPEQIDYILKSSEKGG